MGDKETWQYAEIGDFEGVKKRVEFKGSASVNTEKDSFGRTALIYASFNGYLPIAQYLISHGANINDKDNDGYTSLHYVCYPNSSVADSTAVEIMKTLIANGANEAIKNSHDNKTPEEYAKSKTLRKAVIQAVKDRRKGKLQSYIAKPSSLQPLISPSSSSSLSSTSSNLSFSGSILSASSSSSSAFNSLNTFPNELAQEKAARQQLQAQFNQLQQQLSTSQQETQQLQQQISTSQQQLSIAQQQISTSQLQLSTIQQEKSQLQQQLSTLQQEKTQLQQKVTSLEQEITSLRRNSSSLSSSPSSPPINNQSVLPQFPLTSLQSATNNFSDSNKLGEGGFGFVFKGSLLGTEVAIKKLASNSMQGHKEFIAEIISLSRFRHPNIVNLIGFAEEGTERCLVYEIIPNGSLRDRLDRKNNTPSLTWPQRQFIAFGIATGMNYLQNADPQAPFFHLDLKSANVLLDSQFQPKLSDFGLTRPLVIGADANNYAKTNTFEGDLSYCCPEYKDQGKVSRKTDVFSYGCILIELLSGQFITSQLRSAIKSVFSKKKRDLKQDLDPSINWDDESLFKSAMEYASIAADCVDEDRIQRPSFGKIIQDLGGVEVKQLSGEQSNVDESVERECIRCSQGPTDAKFIPCNHAAVCQKCARGIKERSGNCPICHVGVQGFIVGDYKKTFIQ